MLSASVSLGRHRAEIRHTCMHVQVRHTIYIYSYVPVANCITVIPRKTVTDISSVFIALIIDKTGAYTHATQNKSSRDLR